MTNPLTVVLTSGRGGMRFNPFGKPLAEVTLADLGALKQVREGWYVEYKSEVGTARAVAKSVSAFANHYGGWVFYGISAPSGGPGCAEAFPGVPTADLPAMLDRIRDAVRQSVSPTPHFDVTTIDGPSDELGLPPDHSIIVLAVPEGSDAPYVHADGVIFRRVADASNPKPETDRALLDALWRRGRNRRKLLARRLEHEMTVSKGESDQPRLEVFVLPDPLGDRRQQIRLTFEEFADTLRVNAKDGFNLPFDNLFSSSKGFVGRIVGVNEYQYRVLTYEYWFDGSSTFTIPLNVQPIDTTAHYQHASRFLSQVESLAHQGVIDLNVSFLMLAGMMAIHQRLSLRAGIKGPFYAKARLDNVWRRVSFLDTNAFEKFTEQYGIPMVQDDGTFAPPGTEPGTMLELLASDEAPKSELINAMVLSLPLFAEVAHALGIPSSISLRDAQALITAMFRAGQHIRSTP